MSGTWKTLAKSGQSVETVLDKRGFLPPGPFYFFFWSKRIRIVPFTVDCKDEDTIDEKANGMETRQVIERQTAAIALATCRPLRRGGCYGCLPVPLSASKTWVAEGGGGQLVGSARWALGPWNLMEPFTLGEADGRKEGPAASLHIFLVLPLLRPFFPFSPNITSLSRFLHILFFSYQEIHSTLDEQSCL